jgi:hypothetical protein
VDDIFPPTVMVMTLSRAAFKPVQNWVNIDHKAAFTISLIMTSYTAAPKPVQNWVNIVNKADSTMYTKPF